MLDDALASLADKRFASAITLALAAEGILPPVSGRLDISADLKSKIAAKIGCSPKTVNDEALNYTRNILKHRDPDKPEPDWSRITEGEAARAICRALFRFAEIHDHDQQSDLMGVFANALKLQHRVDDTEFAQVCVEFRTQVAKFAPVCSVVVNTEIST
jgi:hypothetical protein